MIIALSLLSTVSASSLSLGLCEGDYVPHCKVVAISEAEAQVALSCWWKSCEATDDGQESETDFSFTEVRDFEGAFVRAFVDGEADHRKDFGRRKNTKAVEEAGGWSKYMTSKAFSKKLSFEFGTCRLAIRDGSGKVKEADSGTYDVEFRVRRGKDVFFKKALGEACWLGETTHQAVAYYLPSKKGALVFAALTECAGPPPGYFGEDDAGSQIAARSESISFIPLSDLPELATCLPAPPK
ncbi:MAG: hypothetical protein IV100_19585 [Myxococcales bacterium]|nr:hypothetical protein [Myxococcales bacterium]